MQHHIIEKLGLHLSKKIKSESDVVYLFIEIGKFLEQEESRDYNLLRFYRNWVAHYKIDRESAFRLVGDFPERLESLMDDFFKKDIGKYQQLSEEISRFIAFNNLFSELNRFLESNDILNTITTKEDQLKFSYLLIDILSDVPLIFPPNKFDNLRSFTFSKIHLKGSIKDPLTTWHIITKGSELQGPVILELDSLT
ncbi:MAG: hypothetical protein WC444_03990 [Candidatus Paceibacterota bacterium]